jgi:hypothetical protein
MWPRLGLEKSTAVRTSRAAVTATGEISIAPTTARSASMFHDRADARAGLHAARSCVRSTVRRSSSTSRRVPSSPHRRRRAQKGIAVSRRRASSGSAWQAARVEVTQSIDERKRAREDVAQDVVDKIVTDTDGSADHPSA